MKKITKYILCLLLCAFCLPVNAQAKDLIPGGQVIGLELRDNTVTVAAIDDTLGSACKAAGIAPGDQIVSIDGIIVHSAEDIHRALHRSHGTVSITVNRAGREQTFSLSPQITSTGPKLGLYLRQGVTGVGTVTWYDPDSGKFGTLGHGVGNNGQLLKLASGHAYRARVTTVRKGRSGAPGQLMGSIESRTPIGELTENTAQGVFGISQSGWEGRAIPVASKSEIRTGGATIRSTVEGTSLQEYSVEILKIYPQDRGGGRNLLLRVTDPELLALTGGIVQGMSGSPIIQDGKLVGAVTHVLVNDPTTGYGIFIENMLDAAA